jgi:hypothetical protein
MVGTINQKNMFSVLNEEQETQVTQEVEQKTQDIEQVTQEVEQVTQEVEQKTRSTFKGREVVPLVRKAIQKCRKEVESHSVTKQAAPTPTNTPVQTSTTPTKFMVATSYLEQNRPVRHQQTATGSYPTVDSKCTKACTRALLQENGRYGVCTKPSCTFAHSLDELRDTMCRFDASCRTINGTRRNDWTIDTSNVCKYRHSIESKEAWFRRTGQSIPALPQTKMCKEEPVQTLEGSEQTPFELSQEFQKMANKSLFKQLLMQEFKKKPPLQTVDLPTEPVIDEPTHTYDWNIHRPVEFYNQTFRTQAPSEYTYGDSVHTYGDSVHTYGDSIHRDSVVHKRDRSLSPDHRSHARSVHVITVPTKELAEIAVKSLIDREIYNFKIVLG